MAKKKAADKPKSANGSGQVVGTTGTEATTTAAATLTPEQEAEIEKKKQEKREETNRRRDAQAETARVFKKLAAGLDDAMKAGLVFNLGNLLPDNDAVYELINQGDRAIAVGFPTLDRPRLAPIRGKSINDLKADRSAVMARFVAREITEDEATALIAKIENSINRLRAAEKKAAAAQQPPAASGSGQTTGA